MTVHEQKKRGGVGRPRSARSHRAILDATLELVAEEGIQGTRIEAIAARAGVGKTTIYRRWLSKEALILDALSELHGHGKLVDTGELRADLLTFLKEPFHMLETHPLHERLVFRLFGEARAHPEFARVLYERVYAPRLQCMTHFIERAQERGELRPNVDTVFLASLLMGPLLYYKLATRVLPSSYSSHELLEQIVDAVLHGIGTDP